MNTSSDLEKELGSIKQLMERSSRFISLSGLSGIMAGMYALLGGGLAYYILYYPNSPFGYRFFYVNEQQALWQLLGIALMVLVLALATGLWLTYRNCQKKGQLFWGKTSKNLLLSMAIPLITGGILILIFLARGHFFIVAPACLIFYGLALVNGSHYTLNEVKYLGILEIMLGLCCALLPGYGLLFWVAGFGLLHIIYGSVMYIKYER